MPSPTGSVTLYPRYRYQQPGFKNLTVLLEQVRGEDKATELQNQLIKDCFAHQDFSHATTEQDLATIARYLQHKPAFEEFNRQLAAKARNGKCLGIRNVYSKFYDSSFYRDLHDEFKNLTLRGSEAIDKLISLLNDKNAPKELKASLLMNDLARHIPSRRQLDEILTAVDRSYLVPIFNEALRKNKNSIGSDVSKDFVKSPRMRDALAQAALSKKDLKEAGRILQYVAYQNGGYHDMMETVEDSLRMSKHAGLFQLPYAWWTGLRQWVHDDRHTGDFGAFIKQFFTTDARFRPVI